MTRPQPEQAVFDFATDCIENPFISSESFQECRERMNQLKDVKEEFGSLRSPGRNGISRRTLINRSPTSKGREKWAEPLDMSIGSSFATSIKV